MTDDYAVSSSGYDTEPFRSEGRVPEAQTLIGRGVYSVAEVARLIKVQRDAITRWSRGYSYQWKGELRTAPPVFQSVAAAGGEVFLDFADLMEVRVLAEFRRYGVSWHTIRVAAQRVAELRQSSHPFSAKDFRTDGRHILMHVAPEMKDERFLNLVSDQLEFGRLVKPLLKEVDFDANAPLRWWPPTGKREVMIDPQFAFGAPVVRGPGIRTRVLADCYEAEGSFRAAAWWYDIPERLVKAAVGFELSLAA